MFSASTRNERLRRREGYVKKLTGKGATIAGRRAQDSAEVVEDGNAALAGGRDDAGKDFLSPSAAGVSVASEDFAIDDRRPDRLVGPASRGLKSGEFQEGKDLALVGPK